MNNTELHIYENHHTYDLMLPKPAYKNLTIIKPKSKFLPSELPGPLFFVPPILTRLS